MTPPEEQYRAGKWSCHGPRWQDEDDHAASTCAEPDPGAQGPLVLVTDPTEAAAFFADDAVELVAREIQLRGATVPAVLFLEANRAYGPLGSQAMLFFDPVVRRVFGGDVAEARSVLADDAGIERLIERLEELDEEAGLDA